MVRRNLSWGDATFRGLLGLVLLIIGMDVIILFEGVIQWSVPLATFVLAALLEASAFTGHCPIYRAFGRNTPPDEKGWASNDA